jgi:hypothetical protein
MKKNRSLAKSSGPIILPVGTTEGIAR